MTGRILLSILLILLLLSPAAPAQRIEEIEQHWYKAKSIIDGGDYEGAFEHYQKCIAAIAKAGNPPYYINAKYDCYVYSAICRSRLGDYESAIVWYEWALHTAKGMPHKQAVQSRINCNTDIGWALYELHRYEEASKRLYAVLSMLSGSTDDVRLQRAATEVAVGRCLEKLGRTDEARKLILKAYGAMAKLAGAEGNRAEALLSVGDCYRAEGNQEEALRCYWESLRQFKKLPGSAGGEILCYLSVSMALEKQGKLDDALKSIRYAISLFKSIKKPGWLLGECHSRAGSVLLGQGKCAEALKDLEYALSIFKKNVTPYDEVVTCHMLLAEAGKKLGRTEDALKSYGAALDILKKLPLTQSRQQECARAIEELKK